MQSTVRRSVLTAVFVGATLVIAPASAFADHQYAPATPEATVLNVKEFASKAPQTARAAESAASAPGVASVSGSALPRTGADVLVWTLTGGGLLLAGTWLVAIPTRRRSALR